MKHSRLEKSTHHFPTQKNHPGTDQRSQIQGVGRTEKSEGDRRNADILLTCFARRSTKVTQHLGTRIFKEG